MVWTDIIIDILLVIYVIDCLFMGLVIMMQRSKQEGLGAAFGGGFTDSIWGAQTSNVLVKATVWGAIIFFVISISLARLYSYREAQVHVASPVLQELTQPVPTTTSPTNSAVKPMAPTATPATTPAPATTPTPAATPAPVAPAKPSGKAK